MTFRISLRSALIGCALAAAACGGHAAGVSSTSTLSSRTSATTGASASGTSATARAARSHIPAASWPTFDFNAARTGVGPTATGITAADAGSLRVRAVTVDGVVDSSAIELHGVRVGRTRHDLVVVTTSYGNTVGIDARSGRRLWEFRPAHVNATPGNPQVTTASPVADPSGAAVFSASPNGFVHKLSVSTGRVLWSVRVTLLPSREKIASALNVSGRWLVVVTGGYFGDAPPYDGHVMLIDRGTGRVGHVWNSECSNIHRLIAPAACADAAKRGDNAIWGRAGAVIEPGTGNILVATGNGPFNGSTDWGNSALELTSDATRLLHNWTPTNERQLDLSDTDVGSTSPAPLPSFGGRRLAVQGGKDGKLALLDLGRLNGTAGAASSRLGGELGQTSTPGGNELLTAPAVWRTHGRIYVFAADASGTAAYVLADPAHPRLVPAWSKAQAGTSPVIAGGLLYDYDPGGHIAIRRPVSGAVIRELPAPGGHWNSPIVAGGRVIEPTGAYASSATSSALQIWHLPGA